MYHVTWGRHKLTVVPASEPIIQSQALNTPLKRNTVTHTYAQCNKALTHAHGNLHTRTKLTFAPSIYCRVKRLWFRV